MTKKKAKKRRVGRTFIRTFRGRPPEEEPKELDTTPLEMPVGYQQPTPLQDLIAKMVREAVESEKEEEFETIEDADDFEIEDDELLDFSPYELVELEEDEPLEKPVFKTSSEEVAETPEDPSAERQEPEEPAVSETAP